MAQQYSPGFLSGFLVLLVVILIVGCGCLEPEQQTGNITLEEATQIAMQDPRTIQKLGNNDFSITDRGPATISSGSGAPEEVYQITFDVPKGTYQRVIVFVDYSGNVILVDTPYTVKDPASVQEKTLPDSELTDSITMPIIPAAPYACHEHYYIIPAGGDVYLGESCLNVSAGVSSGQIISWYENGRQPGKDNPDERRIVHDSQNFFVSPDEFLGHEGNWYVGDTDRVAFVVKDVILDYAPWTTVPDNISRYPSGDYPGESDMFDAYVSDIINSTNTIDYVAVWVILDETDGISNGYGNGLSAGENVAIRVPQKSDYLNYTKSFVDYVRARGYIVDYIGQADAAVEVRAPPPFMRELEKQLMVKRIVRPKTVQPVIKEMVQRTPDETLDVIIFLTAPEGTAPEPDTPRTEQQVREWYAKNRYLYYVNAQPVVNQLSRENVSISYPGPYPMTGVYGNVPVRLLEKLNARSDIELIELDIPACPI